MERLGLTTRVLQSLQRAGVRTLNDLRGCSRADLSMLPGIGPKGLVELSDALQQEERPTSEAHIVQVEHGIAEYTSAIGALRPELETIPRT